jgi:hypothetical protein
VLEQAFLQMGQWPISRAINGSLWIYAVVQAFHLVALAVFAGALFMVDLRLLGVAMRERPVDEVARGARPWLIGGLLALVLTGIPQMMSNASREYYSEFFWYKMSALAFGLVWTFTLRARVTRRATAGALAKVVALVSVATWISVIVFARLIGLFT